MNVANDTDRAAFAAEIAALRGLRDILTDERDALRRIDPDAVMQLVPVKLARLEMFAALEQCRRGRMGAHGIEPRRADLTRWLEDSAACEEWTRLGEEVRSLNALCVRLAKAQMAHIDRAAAALRRAMGRQSVYGADGREDLSVRGRELAAI